ncbi:CD40 ligand [Melanotaenia boesemani]|uniref:CD40 ligand n=1 Tax=Melanotaenia boesemani TaxID=1250792 RepID=UPI001C04FEA9|nr:CD40 ligand [Melanotaenia boesemani]
MIRTDQTSLAPPPLPPRLGRSQPILIPAQLPPLGHNNKPLIHFLAGVVILHLMLSIGGFIYLLYKDKTLLPENSPLAQERVGYPPTKQQEASSLALARMVIEQPSYTGKEDKSSGFLRWEKTQSVHKNINSYENSWLTILEPGDYYVYSRVTFSKGSAKIPLASRVKLRKSETEKDETVMKAYCSLNSSNISRKSASDPDMCTATQMELLTLEKGNQLSVWVQDLSLVDYEAGATTFGMYKL